MNRNVQKLIFGHVRPGKIQIRLGNRGVWLESTLGIFWIGKDAALPHADNGYSDQIARVCRLICLSWARMSKGTLSDVSAHKYHRWMVLTWHRVYFGESLLRYTEMLIDLKGTSLLHTAKNPMTVITVRTHIEMNVTRGPYASYTWLTNTGPRHRAKLPAAVNQPIHIPCKIISISMMHMH